MLRTAGEVLEQAEALGPEQVEPAFSLKVTGRWDGQSRRRARRTASRFG